MDEDGVDIGPRVTHLMLGLVYHFSGLSPSPGPWAYGPTSDFFFWGRELFYLIFCGFSGFGFVQPFYDTVLRINNFIWFDRIVSVTRLVMVETGEISSNQVIY